MTKSLSFTKGSILPIMIRYTLPLIFTNLIQVFYSIADSVIVSMSGEPEAVGAIGTTTAFINLVINTFIGCSIGTKVVVARYIGAQRSDKVERAVHTSIAASLLLSAICLAVVMPLTAPILSAMGNQGKLLSLSVTYAKLYFLSVPFTAITNFSIAIIQASGDTKAPMFILSASGLLNITLNFIFVTAFDMDVDGVAIATVISTAVSSVLLIAFLIKRCDACKLNFKKLTLKLDTLKEILTVGMPAAIQNALFSFSHMLVQSSVLTVNNALASAESEFQPIVKGCAVCTSIESIASTAVSSIGHSAVPFVAQNRGAGNYERIIKGRRVWYAVSFIASSTIALLLILLKDPLFYIYGITKSSSDPLIALAYDAAFTRMLIMFIPYFLLGFMEIGGAVLQGLGRSFTASLTSLICSCLFRCIWLLTVFTAKPTLSVIFISFPISWLMTSVIHYIFARSEINKKRKTLDTEEKI